ncbi:adenylyltransferase/sulfurtransferase MoeZ [Nocardioides marmotae]|uniref:Probable adenylyltransferase/sulfurtransferase MoeZ n=1 Tax=Nocardioides marmotae TaxID=2663857 RepID=A0A6I3J8U9_9ACTN|nr:adenylyltransferase/sulfurtransferase MoeZ [Nocardioides marmotae]MCR6031500.1 adenylyltransferase/sulfurtransferase MoeZ [Gordonia jinghuaiqii]MBC9733344.1 adenylyltransferase/sulfurtransferase MoeZ [Nocardioides marmotae]MTB84451.1 adenylyltransferase/sulfurtransferase MoeZ [Nocardioides marmotae]MTB95139.1 adenylyltransferase/sulfurtransferase MoeZ [Nocardioides marmotae]QKE02374.1 adenylyltransferase/sulfurtransferase MoeZ [Nocardioides marmotae]
MSFPPLVEPADELTIDEVRRYSRHLIIPDVGMSGQKRLKNAKVLVIGAGGLGSPALLYLAAAGVGTLGIAEFDEVDESNLQRQIIHGQSDIGKSKAQSAKESIAEANPYVEVVVHEQRLDNDNVMDVFRGYDLIVDGTDNFATRYMVNDAAYFLGIPYVWGSIYRFDGQASVFAPTMADDAPCYRCLYPEPPPPGMVPSCAEGGVLGVLCAAIGSIQVNEAIKVLTGIGDPAIGKLVIYDALELEWRKLKVRKDPNCALCGENPTVTGLIDYDAFCGAISDEAADAAVGSTISVTQLEAMLKEREEGTRDFVLVDVREPNEHEINQIPGSVLIPKGEFLNGSALEKLPPVDAGKQVVMHCKSGVRSAETLAIVKGAGYADAVHVGGGVVAWVNQIDPSQPSY